MSKNNGSGNGKKAGKKKSDDDDGGDQATPRTLTIEEQRIIELMKAQANLGGVPFMQQQEDEGPKSHAFWDTQPMNHENSSVEEGAIEPNKPSEEIRAEPYKMPAGFCWANVDVHDDKERKELYDLLANNYVEDDDALFRFDYSQDFLYWALTPPGHKLDFWLGVRAEKSGKLVGFISGVPASAKVRQADAVPLVEINFLCVHKKLRSKRLAPVLIKEITRRVNKSGVFQAVYTAGVVLPVPVASARYFHRALNVKKLINVGFSRLPPKTTMARHVKNYKLPDTPHLSGLRPMTPEDVPGVHKLLTTYLDKFQLKVMFEPDEIGHWLLPRPGVVDSFVMCDKDSGEVTDLCSFYHLPSNILQHKDTLLYAAYSFYNVATSVTWIELMRSCLILAKSGGADVFNALNLMDNEEFLTDLKFGFGDGNLQYYLYNWACPKLKSKEVGIVLL